MMDIVFIEDLRIQTTIGIYDWEKEIRQEVSLNISLANDNRAAAASDHIGDTVDYKAVAKRLIGFVEGNRFELVETLAERCAEIIIAEFEVPWVRIRASKPGAVRGSVAVGVVIERGEKTA